MSPTVLVTGAAGFIGSHTVLELLNAGFEVVALDNFSNAVPDSDGNAVSLKRVEHITKKHIQFYNVDVTNKEALVDVFDKHNIHSVVHFAGLKSVGESVHKPLDYYSNNLISTLSLLHAMKEKGVKNIIFSSSATVYGTPEKLPITETQAVGRTIANPYGRTKYFIEEILKDLAAAEPDWNIIALRYFNPVGAHESGLIGEDPKGIPNNLMPYVSQVCVGKLPHVNVFGNDYDTADGTGIRDYIHVVDLAKGHVAALRKIDNGLGGQFKVYNLGTGRGYSVLEMIRALEKASGKKIPYKIEGRRQGDVATVFCDPTYALKELGWKAELNLEDMCRDLWKWQSLNPKGFVTEFLAG